MSCCPKGSWGSLIPDPEYQCQGQELTLDDLPIYVVGQGEKCLIWNYHILGFRDGRGHQLCDLLATKGYMVVMPDYFRGKSQDPTKSEVKQFLIDQTKWSKLKSDIEDKVMVFAKEKGAKKFGAIGTCWGSYVVLRSCGHPDFKAGVSFHPSHPIMMSFLNEDERIILEGLQGKPQLFCPAGNDHENVKPGGMDQECLGDDLTIVEFPNMLHGWTIRGDLKQDGVQEAILKAMDEAVNFLNKHMA